MASNADQQQAPGNAAPADGEEVGFGAAFSERSADPGKDEIETQSGADEAPDKAPAEAGADEAPGKPATEAGQSGKADAFDPFAGMTPEQRSHWERVSNSERSNRGRVGALTKKSNDLDAKLKAASGAPRQGEEEDRAEERAEGQDDKPTLDKRLQQATEEYGDVVGPLVEALNEVRAEIDAIKKPQVQADEDADAAKIANDLAELEKVHPDFREYDESNADFDKWLSEQPQKVIDLANSFDPREVSLVLTTYKTERSIELAQGGEEDAPGQQPNATDTKRARQLEAGRQVPGKGQPTAAGVPNDFSSAFSARAKVKT